MYYKYSTIIDFINRKKYYIAIVQQFCDTGEYLATFDNFEIRSPDFAKLPQFPEYCPSIRASVRKNYMTRGIIIS